MPSKKKETPVEAEIIEEKVEVNKEYCYTPRRSGGGFVFGSLLLILGVFLILENYLSIDLMRYFWPIVLLLLGARLVYRSFNR